MMSWKVFSIVFFISVQIAGNMLFDSLYVNIFLSDSTKTNYLSSDVMYLPDGVTIGELHKYHGNIKNLEFVYRGGVLYRKSHNFIHSPHSLWYVLPSKDGVIQKAIGIQYSYKDNNGIIFLDEDDFRDSRRLRGDHYIDTIGLMTIEQNQHYYGALQGLIEWRLLRRLQYHLSGNIGYTIRRGHRLQESLIALYQGEEETDTYREYENNSRYIALNDKARLLTSEIMISRTKLLFAKSYYRMALRYRWTFDKNEMAYHPIKKSYYGQLVSVFFLRRLIQYTSQDDHYHSLEWYMSLHRKLWKGKKITLEIPLMGYSLFANVKQFRRKHMNKWGEDYWGITDNRWSSYNGGGAAYYSLQLHYKNIYLEQCSEGFFDYGILSKRYFVGKIGLYGTYSLPFGKINGGVAIPLWTYRHDETFSIKGSFFW